MAETLATADGQPVILDPADQAFAAAMAAPEPDQRPDYPAPARKRDLDAPHGRDAAGTPLAPHGHKADGRPRVTPPGPGRPGKQDRKDAAPRVQKPSAALAPSLPPADYASGLAEFGEGLWAALAFLPPTQAQATILRVNMPGLVQGVALSAQHNPMVRRGVEYVSGEGGWMINAAMLIAPFLLQSMALWFRPDKLSEQLGAGKDELAAIARKDLRDMIDKQKAALSAEIAAYTAAEEREAA